MKINSSIIYALIPELRENFHNSQIRKFKFSPDWKEFLILVQKGKESKTLFFSTHPEYCRITSLTREEARPFQGWIVSSLFSAALDACIQDIEQIDFDRIIKFSLQVETELEKKELELYFELTGRNSNAILVQPASSKFETKPGIILESLKKIKPGRSRVRQILPGIKYILPPPPKKRNPHKISVEKFKKVILNHPGENIFEVLSSHFMGMNHLLTKKILEKAKGSDVLGPPSLDTLWQGFKSVFHQISNHKISPFLILDSEEKPVGISLFDLKSIPEKCKLPFPDMNSTLKRFFTMEAEKDKGTKRLQTIQRLIQKSMEKLKKKKENLKVELSQVHEAQEHRKFGDLIFSHLKKIKKGTEFVFLPDLFTVKHKKIKIKLDPSLSPRGNAEAYYRRYQKAQTGAKEIERMIIQTRSEIRDIEKLKSELDVEEKPNLEKIETKLSALGLIKASKPKAKTKKSSKYSPREFISADGWRVLVGRNNRENDHLTFKIARPDDLWFHAQNTAGSHVVLRRGERKKHPTHKALEQAAALAAYYSQAKTSKKVSVIYTLVKYVKKPKGALPGLVKVERMKSILIEPKLIK